MKNTFIDDDGHNRLLIENCYSPKNKKAGPKLATSGQPCSASIHPNRLALSQMYTCLLKADFHYGRFARAGGALTSGHAQYCLSRALHFASVHRRARLEVEQLSTFWRTKRATKSTRWRILKSWIQ